MTRSQRRSVGGGKNGVYESMEEVAPLKLPLELTVRINLYGFARIRV